MNYIDFSNAPENPIERLVWLSGINAAVQKEINGAWQLAYFDARQQGMFPEALALGLHSLKRALAWTRHENEARSRVITRWRDGF
jgi:hypothetical protein